MYGVYIHFDRREETVDDDGREGTIGCGQKVFSKQQKINKYQITYSLNFDKLHRRSR